MSLVLYTAEQMENRLSHGAILCTREQMDEYYLMHYRTKGSKNGVRRYQDESGSLTPEGYRHYAEMYGWNKRLSKVDRLQNRATRARDQYNEAVEATRSAKERANRANERNERGNKWTRQANEAADSLAKASANKTEADNQKIIADYRMAKRNGGFGSGRLEKQASRAAEAANKAQADLDNAQALYDEAQKTALIKNSTGFSGFMARHRQANANRANEAFEDAKENLIYTKGKSERAQSKVDAYLDKMEKKADKIDSKINKRFDESQLEQAKGLVDDLKKNGIIDKNAGQLTSIAKMENKKTSIANDSDLAIRDAITGLGKIIKEDLDDHSYVTSVKVGNNVEAYVKIKRDGKDVNVTSYAEEGLIKQGLAKKAIGKVEEALGKITNDVNRAEKVRKLDTENEKQKFVEESRREQLDLAVAKNDLKTISDEATRRLAERGNKHPTLEESVAEMNKIQDEARARSEKRDPEAQREADIAEYSGTYGWNKENQADLRRSFGQGLDNLSEHARRELGNAMMDCLDTVGKEISDKVKRGEKINKDDYSEFETIGQWLTEEIYERSGSWNAGEFKDGSKAKQVHDKMLQTSNKMDAHADSVRKKLGLSEKAEWWSSSKDAESVRLQQALKSDAVWDSLNKAYDKGEKDLCGAILQDLGFPDNSANRSVIFRYAFID